MGAGAGGRSDDVVAGKTSVGQKSGDIGIGTATGVGEAIPGSSVGGAAGGRDASK